MFTSAGALTAVLADSLDLTPANMLKATMVVRNAAWSEFLFSPERFSLLSFNATPHLDEPALLTYR